MLAHFMIACIAVFETKLDWTSGMMTKILSTWGALWKKERKGWRNEWMEEGGREGILTILHFLVIYLQKTNFIIYLNVSWMWKKSTSAILPLPESFSSIRNAGRFANGHSCMFQKNFVCYFRIVFISFWSVVSQPVGCDPFEGQMTHSQGSSETIGKHIYLHLWFITVTKLVMK